MQAERGIPRAVFAADRKAAAALTTRCRNDYLIATSETRSRMASLLA